MTDKAVIILECGEINMLRILCDELQKIIDSRAEFNDVELNYMEERD